MIKWVRAVVENLKSRKEQRKFKLIFKKTIYTETVYNGHVLWTRHAYIRFYENGFGLRDVKFNGDLDGDRLKSHPYWCQTIIPWLDGEEGSI